MTDSAPGAPGSEHPTIEVLADAAEDLLPDDEARLVTDHLAMCADCAQTAAALADVCVTLRDAPAPPMPDAVFNRLQDVVRSESARRASGVAAAEVETAAIEAAKRTELGTFGRNPGVTKVVQNAWADDLAEG